MSNNRSLINSSFNQVSDYDANTGLVTGLTVANLTVTGSANIAGVGVIGNIASINLNGNANTVLSGNGTWVEQTGGGGIPGGSNTEVQFNDANTFGGSANFTFDKLSNTLSTDFINTGYVGQANANIVFSNNEIYISATGHSNNIIIDSAPSGATRITVTDPQGAAFVLTNSGTGVIQTANPGQGINVTGGGDLPLRANGTLLNIGANGKISTGDVANLIITGGSNAQVLTTDGTGNLSWTTASSGGNVTPIPAIHFDVTADANNQTFTSSTLESYAANTDLTVFWNGTLLEVENYTLSGNTLTVNRPLFTDDNIDITRQFATSNAVSAAGSNTEVQFNDNGLLAASNAFAFNTASNTLSIGNTLIVNNSIYPADVASGTGASLTLYGGETDSGALGGALNLQGGGGNVANSVGGNVNITGGYVNNGGPGGNVNIGVDHTTAVNIGTNTNVTGNITANGFSSNHVGSMGWYETLGGNIISTPSLITWTLSSSQYLSSTPTNLQLSLSGSNTFTYTGTDPATFVITYQIISTPQSVTALIRGTSDSNPANTIIGPVTTQTTISGDGHLYGTLPISLNTGGTFYLSATSGTGSNSTISTGTFSTQMQITRIR